MNEAKIWASMLLLLLSSCSQGGDKTVKDDPVIGGLCLVPGETACSTDDYGRSVLLLCAEDVTGDLTWRTARVCLSGCSNGSCVEPDALIQEDVAGDTAPNDVLQDVSPSDSGEVSPPDVMSEMQSDGCVPDCSGRVCGTDGCGGTCGSCLASEVCLADGSSCCTPSCFGKSCGDNGCGGSCGTCPTGMECNAYFQCGPPCIPNCEGKECGSDGCTGSCGGCEPGKACGATGQCTVCVPQCVGKTCGDDGCGGLCGGCAFGYECQNGSCVVACIPQCGGKECGPDGCNHTCGDCMPGESCINGQCLIVCEPECTGKVCGGDGCGGNCGKCPPWAWCTAQGQCETDCVPTCTREDGTVRDCGSDGCGGLCGGCPTGQYCSPYGNCLIPEGPCGTVTSDGWCDGNVLMMCISASLSVADCATFGKNVLCEWVDNLQEYGCVPHGECVPSCAGKVCGDDGCGGICGECPYPQTCELGQCVGETLCGDVSYYGCCSENTVLWCDSGALWHMNCDLMQDPAQRFCGWNDDLGFYDCVASPVEGPPTHPYYCGGPCVPDCSGKQCGDDGCGGTCGECPFGLTCTDNLCTGENGGCGSYGAQAVCQGDVVVWCEDNHVLFMDCQAMGPAYHCGWVADLFSNWCYEEECVPDCTNRECGPDGCGYVCGYCMSTMYCNDLFQCVYGSGFCGDIDYTGICDGNTVKWCQNGVLQSFDCGNLGPTWQCGWFASGEYYWCID